MASKKAQYHHGDLSSALIAKGLELVAKTEDGDVGLREVARETGVSATAVYRHFPDKDAFLSALAMAGFEMLFDAQQAAADRKAGDEEGFRATGQAYVHFAVANPALFRLMSNRMPTARDVADGCRPEGSRAGRLLQDYVARLMPGAGADERRVTEVQAMALVHGLAVMILGGQIPNDPKLIDAAVDRFGTWRAPDA